MQMMGLKKEVKRTVRKAGADEERESTEEGKRAVRAERERRRELLAELEREEADGKATGSKGLPPVRWVPASRVPWA